MKNAIACCQFPTTVLFLDDKSRFLESLVLNLEENFPYKIFTSPNDALHFLAHENNITKIRHKWLAGIDSEEQELSEAYPHLMVGINIADIYKEIYLQDRFSEVSVIVVDYAMPGMNGIEFARKIKNVEPAVKIFMITGEADDGLAIKAFNEGVIDRFLKKNAPNFYTDLNNSIAQLQQEYFHELSKNIIKSLSSNKNCCLNDPIFIEFFQNFCQQNSIVEYYLIDEMGGFLLLDNFGEHTFLITKSEEVLENYANIAIDNEAPAEICDALAHKEKIPFFFSQHDLELPVELWHNYLHTAVKLEGKKNRYYYAVIKDQTNIYRMRPSEIVSYRDYQKNVSFP
jgi:CheY-like chemotaxis protein